MFASLWNNLNSTTFERLFVIFCCGLYCIYEQACVQTRLYLQSSTLHSVSGRGLRQGKSAGKAEIRCELLSELLRTKEINSGDLWEAEGVYTKRKKTHSHGSSMALTFSSLTS